MQTSAPAPRRQTTLMPAASRAARAADIEQSDREFIMRKQTGKPQQILDALARQDSREALRLAASFPHLGEHKEAITRGWAAVYCLAMGYPSSWNERRLKVSAMPSSRKSPLSSSERTARRLKNAEAKLERLKRELT